MKEGREDLVVSPVCCSTHLYVFCPVAVVVEQFGSGLDSNLGWEKLLVSPGTLARLVAFDGIDKQPCDQISTRMSQNPVHGICLFESR